MFGHDDQGGSHDDMKASLLQELIEKLMEMKDGGGEQKPDPMAMKDDSAMDGKPEPDEDDAQDPKMDLMLEMKKGAAGDGDDADPAKDDEADMKGPVDFAALARKHRVGL